MQSVDNSQSRGEYYCRLYWAHVLINRRKYTLIKKYALNKYVRLLTRLYSIMTEQIALSLTHALGVINNGVKYNNIIAVQP